MKIGIDAKRAYQNKSGLGNYSRDIISSLIKEEMTDIQLFTPEVKSQFYKTPEKIKVHTPKIKLLKNYWRLFGIKKIIQKENIEIFHGLSNEIPIGLTKKTKSVVTIHDVIFKKHPYFYNYFDRLVYAKKTEYACKKANKIISVSEQTKNDLIYYFNVPPEKIEVIYQSCHEAFKTDLKNENILNKYQIPDDFILYVGTIEKRKNLKLILKNILNKPEINLVCIGEKKSYYNDVLKFIKEKKINNNIIFLTLDSVNDLSDIYKKAKCLVYPSIYEGFGIPIIEALYSQIPVITTNQPVFKEVGGDYCFYTNNDQELKNILDKIWIKKKTKNILARKWAENFNSTKQAKQIINLYNELLK